MTTIFSPENVVHTYTSKQAEEDGLLFDVDLILKRPLKNSRGPKK